MEVLRRNPHPLVTELAESGLGDQTILEIVGHVSHQMLARYSHIRIEAKLDALEAPSRSHNGSSRCRRPHVSNWCGEQLGQTESSGGRSGAPHCGEESTG